LTFQQSTSARAGSLRLAVSGVKHRFSALCLDAAQAALEDEAAKLAKKN
jgi:hypothetical protein